MSSSSASASPRRLCALILLALGAGLYALSLSSASAEFTAAQHSQLALYVGGLTAVLAALAAAAPARLRGLVSAGFGALIVMSHFAWLTSVAAAHPLLQLAYALAAAVLIWGILRALNSPRIRTIASALAAVSLGLAIVVAAPWSLGESEDASSFTLGASEASDVPDIVFLSFDSLIPEALARTLIPGAEPAYADALADHGVRRIANGYSAFVPTRAALNSLLQLDDVKFAELEPAERRDFFTGARRGGIADLLRPRGYRIETWFDSAYMGERAGPHVDRLRAGFGDAVLCNQVTSPLALMARCHPAIRGWLDASDPRLPSEQVGDAVAETLAARQADDAPLFLMAHIYAPGHTAANARFGKSDRKFVHSDADRRETYLDYFNRKSGVAAAQIDSILSAAAASPRRTLVMIYGDHGPYTTRRLPLDKQSGLPRDTDQTLRYVTDRHAVLLGLWPGEACPDALAPLAAQTATLSSDFARAVLRCAVGDVPDRTDAPFIALPGGQRIDPTYYPYEPNMP